MIEWVPKTTTLKGFLEDAMTENELKAYKQYPSARNVTNEYLVFISLQDWHD